MSFFFLLMLSIQSFAGWVIVEKVNVSDMAFTDSTIMIIQDNKVKLIERKLTTVYDLDNNVITFINPLTKSYWKGTISDFKKESKKAIKIHLEDALNTVRDSQKLMYKLMYEDLLKMTEDKEQNISLEKLNIEVKRTRERTTILNYAADKYQLWKGTILIEDVWIGKNIGIADELDIEKFSSLKNEIITDVDQITYQASSDYIALMRRGYVLKTIEYGFGFKNLKEVTKLEEKEILEEEFLPPTEYEKASIADLRIFKKTTRDAENYREY